MELWLHPEAQEEWNELPSGEYRAMANALSKLRELGEQLSSPPFFLSKGRGNRRKAPNGDGTPLEGAGNMKSRPVNFDDAIAERCANDPDFRDYWERTALARAVATAVIRYRSEQSLSQRALADRKSVV